MDYKWGYIA